MSELEQLRADLLAEVIKSFPSLTSSDHEALTRVASLSDYFARFVRQYPEELLALFASGDMVGRYPVGPTMPPHDSIDIDQLDSWLRGVRSREMIRIIYRDLVGLADLEETTRDLSSLADQLTDIAVTVHFEHLTDLLGTPMGPSGKVQEMSVLALGKLGANELNLSSDIDLVFLFEEGGEVSGNRSLSNAEFFTRLSRAVIASLDKPTDEGFVFRVDMRLRPYGDSGALILPLAAMEKYYLEQGREWERYAFIKARPCAGNKELGQRFLSWLTPFVYRRHLDFGAIESLREMKRLINYEVDVKGLADDLKLGHGGIREVEFVVQAYQLVWGGTAPHLRERSLLRVLPLLVTDGLLEADDANRLEQAYRFLRDSEHAIQAESDRQTQQLPQQALSRERLADAMGFEHYSSYREALARHRAGVAQLFAAFMGANSAEHASQAASDRQWISVWQSPDSQHSISMLESSGFERPEQVAADLVSFARRLEQDDVHEIGLDRISRLMPSLLGLVAREQQPDLTLQRLLLIIEEIARRSTYVAFLLENLDALKRVVHLSAMSPWFAERLSSLPILLYELTDRVTEEQGFERDRLQEELRQLCHSLDLLDLEAQMDSLRQFKNGAVLKVAAFELLELLPIMKASDALTDIAELVINRAFELAWAYLTDRHGSPCDVDGNKVDNGFAVVAYGKLGGIELGYGSDLDLVFLYEADRQGVTDGEKSVDNATFYIRLGQRIVHILTSLTRLGLLYEIDLRLRPRGNAGPIVTSLAAYEKYLDEEAWTWEHQALVRARFIAGDAMLRTRFESIRREVLTRRRDKTALLQDVVSMRARMQAQLEATPGPTASGPTASEPAAPGDAVMLSGFDLKLGAGAIVDIEFMVQFAVLAESHDRPELTRWTDKMRILDDLREAGLYSEAEVSLLQRAYIAYRSAVHYRSLGGEMTSYEQLNQYRQDVVEIWTRHMVAAPN